VSLSCVWLPLYYFLSLLLTTPGVYLGVFGGIYALGRYVGKEGREGGREGGRGKRALELKLPFFHVKQRWDCSSS